MTYTVMALVAAFLVAGLDQVVLRTNLLRRKAFWTAYAIIVLFQLIVNGILTALPVVRYDRSAILGPRLAYAPVEDLLFGFSMVLFTLTIWVWAGRRAAVRAGAGRSTS